MWPLIDYKKTNEFGRNRKYTFIFISVFRSIKLFQALVDTRVLWSDVKNVCCSNFNRIASKRITKSFAVIFFLFKNMVKKHSFLRPIISRCDLFKVIYVMVGAKWWQYGIRTHYLSMGKYIRYSILSLFQFAKLFFPSLNLSPKSSEDFKKSRRQIHKISYVWKLA